MDIMDFFYRNAGFDVASVPEPKENYDLCEHWRSSHFKHIAANCMQHGLEAKATEKKRNDALISGDPEVVFADGNPFGRDSALRLGKALHAMIEGREQDIIVWSIPRLDKKTKPEGAKLIQQATKSGNLLVRGSELEQAKVLHERIQRLSKLKGYADLADIIKMHCCVEVPVYCEVKGVPFKGLPDHLAWDGERLVWIDWKTTSAETDREVDNSIRKFRYDLQAVHHGVCLWSWISDGRLDNDFPGLREARESGKLRLEHRLVFIASNHDWLWQRTINADWWQSSLDQWMRGVDRVIAHEDGAWSRPAGEVVEVGKGWL